MAPPKASQAPGEWVNWAGDQSCLPAAIVSPASREELSEAVAAAAVGGGKVSVAGSGHSFTETAMTSGTMLRVEMILFNAQFMSQFEKQLSKFL